MFLHLDLLYGNHYIVRPPPLERDSRMHSMTELDDYLRESRELFEADLCELLRISSISADTQYRDDVLLAAKWVANQFRSLGFETETIEGSGHPIVYAESPQVENAPTVLIYGHYDVQPPDPLEEWITPPFEPTQRDGNIYARGATDDKGQMLTHVKSAQAWVQTAGSLPLNLKYVIEGEEEIGSIGLQKFLVENPQKLKSDVAVVSDTCQFARGKPAITYGLRGIAYFELRLTGPQQDLHSGTFGGCLTNPANAMCMMLSGLMDEDGKILIPGFYEDVIPLSDSEREQFDGLPFDEAAFAERLGIDRLHGERGFSTLEHRWARPTLKDADQRPKKKTPPKKGKWNRTESPGSSFDQPVTISSEAEPSRGEDLAAKSGRKRQRFGNVSPAVGDSLRSTDTRQHSEVAERTGLLKVLRLVVRTVLAHVVP